MNQAANSTIAADVSVDATPSWGTMAALGVIAVVLAPIAAWLYGVVGVGLVGLLAVAVAATSWMTHRLEAHLIREDKVVAGLLAASGVRMAVPLAVALLCVTVGSRLIPASSVLLLLPLYLSVLLADTFNQVRRRTGHARFNAAWISPAGSKRREQG